MAPDPGSATLIKILSNLDSDLHAEHERGWEERAELDEEASVPAPNVSKLHLTTGMGGIQPAPVHLNIMQHFHQRQKLNGTIMEQEQ
jgi:hypothetical protein